jgi:hypothetical protein
MGDKFIVARSGQYAALGDRQLEMMAGTLPFPGPTAAAVDRRADVGGPAMRASGAPPNWGDARDLSAFGARSRYGWTIAS